MTEASPSPAPNAEKQPLQAQPIDAQPLTQRGRSVWLFVAAQAVALALLFGLILVGPLGDEMRALELLLAAGMLMAVLWAGARRWKIMRELARLEALLPKVHRAEEPIESLSQIDGRLAPLAGLCQDLIRDLRLQRARTAQLQNETRQRIASRTEALERTIGALRQQAARDALTGLFNRRMLDAYLPEAVERCKAGTSPMCLMMMDLDDFKSLNDTLGHAAGDQLLQSFAQIIRSTIRATDLAFRCGGDEFVVVLEGCSMESGRAVADRIGSLGDALGRTYRLLPPPRVSIGLADLTGLPEQTPKAILQKADEVLYRVKAEHHAAARLLKTA